MGETPHRVARDLPALARASHPAPRHDWTADALTMWIVDALPAANRGLTAERVHLRLVERGVDCRRHEVRDALAWLVQRGRVRTRGGYDHHPYEYLACPDPTTADATIGPPSLLDEEERR